MCKRRLSKPFAPFRTSQPTTILRRTRFGAVEIDNHRCLWKIDCYDQREPDLGAEDPADAATTERVLTILAEEY